MRPVFLTEAGNEAYPASLYACSSRESPVVFLLGTSLREEETDDAEALISFVEQMDENADYSLFVYRVRSWDDDFSPWAASVSGRSFGCRGTDTLAFLIESIPRIKALIPSASFFIPIGYSLAGLFSLWTVYAADAFSGAASCSGSLWFPGFREFTENSGIKKAGSAVYLSLGGKEAAVSDPVMSTISVRTKEQLGILKKDKNVRISTLEMNSGGHFANAAKRLAKAVVWLQKELG